MKTFQIANRLKAAVLSVLLPAFAFTGSPVRANPSGGVVAHGAATIANVAANQLRIHQTSPTVVINWQNFSIARGEMTRFAQPTNGTALNRVVSGNISQIHGSLKANANVYVINPNGIVVGPTGVIDVGGRAVLSTLDVDDDDFLRGGPDRFYGKTTTGVTNFGTISSAGGDVVLMGGFVDNQGQIGALNGTVAIGAGGDILLEEGAGAKITVRGSSDYTGTGINNAGTIRGASAELKAHGNVYALAINNGGAIRANGADRSGGRVRLTASGGSSNINLGANSSIVARAGGNGGQVAIDAGQGEARIGGRIDATGAGAGGTVSVVGNQVIQEAGSVVDASGTASGGTAALDARANLRVAGTVQARGSQAAGGKVDLTGNDILVQNTAAVLVDGATKGGVLRIGGDFQGRDTGLREASTTQVDEGARLSADASAGDAGTAIVWANHDTLFLGEVSASARGSVGNGGLIEVSGKEWLHFDGDVAVTSVGGKAGTVLFDPGDVIVGATGPDVPPLGSPVSTSTIAISAVNKTLQDGANVLIVTDGGSIEIQDQGGGGADLSGATAGNRDAAIQWTNSQSSFGAFASGSIVVNNHIRTSGGGSINLLAGWSGTMGDPALSLAPQAAWDFYVGQGKFGANGGSVFVGSGAMARHVEVGSRFGNTNVAGYDVRVIGSDVTAEHRYAQIGFRDGGQVFGPRLNRGGDFRLDMKVGPASGSGAWLLSDGKNSAGNMAAAGVNDPIVAVVGNDFGQEADVNGDGIMDGVHGINSTGVVTESFIPYANHFNSAITGNWWWQQIEDAGSLETKDPLNLGGLRPEHGAGRVNSRADINVLARGNVIVQAGSGQAHNGAQIGHGGLNHGSSGGAGTTVRDIGNESVNNSAFSNAGVENNQMERRWSFNGSFTDRNATAIGRLAPVYGNINVLAGIDTSKVVVVNRSAGSVTASHSGSGDVLLRAAQTFKTSNASSNSPAHIGHGGVGQFGEFYGDITVEAGGNITLLAGEATRSAAVIGHAVFGHAYWNATSVVDQQLRFFATTGDFDNPNLRKGELFSGNVTTGFDPALDPAADLRYTLGNGFGYQPDPVGDPAGWAFVGHTDDGNFVPVATDMTGATLTGQFVNFNSISGNEAERVILMNPLLYTRGDDEGGIHSTTPGVSQGRNTLAPLTLAPTSTAGTPIVVEALNGSTVNGFHGNIRVNARNGGIILRAYTTEGVTGSFARDSRYAAIGHGGTEFGAGSEGSGYNNAVFGTPSIGGISGGAITGTVDAREVVNFRITLGSEIDQSGSQSMIGGVGSAYNRYGLNFTTITGDIDVNAGGAINMTAGNDVRDYTRIGHGGFAVSDFETSSFILGDIRIRAGGAINVTGGGEVTNLVRADNFSMQAWSQIGHGGSNTGYLGYFGDIDIEAGGSILLRNGAYRFNFAKIGHLGADDRGGQTGGDFTRNEHFRDSSIETTIATSLTADTATVTYASSTGGINGSRDFSGTGAGTLVGGARNTSDIRVVAGGSVTLNHMQDGLRQPPGRTGTIGDVNNTTLGLRTDESFAMIGHGGINSHVLRSDNVAGNYSIKLGHIEVEARGGDVNLENGTGDSRWTRIGHGVMEDRVDDSPTSPVGIQAIQLAGDISVKASRDILVNADAAAENERDENFNAIFGPAAPSRLNPVVIGHGGVYNNLDVVVLSRGENLNGILASSDITAQAGRHMYVLGGKGVEASSAQVGHGFASDLGNDAARRDGNAYGFAGDISVRVNGNLVVRGNANAWSGQPFSIENTGRSVTGAFAAIGHGGYQLDAPAFGDISVYVGQDLGIYAQTRTDPETTTPGSSPYTVANQDTDAIGSVYNFAKIGHLAAENGNRNFTINSGTGVVTHTANDHVLSVNHEGDINVVVGRDLRLHGGTTPNVDTQSIWGAFAQIGHGGPSVTGDYFKGDITVLVKRNLEVFKGSERTAASASTRSFNNYAMIGHGDYLFDTDPALSSLFRQTARAVREGDLVVATGNNATFSGALIGHLDPLLSPQDVIGDTRVAVSRLNPFYGGTGRLAAVNSTVFVSGGFGFGSQMEFYMPSRSRNFMDDTTRINERTVTFTEAPDDFEIPFNPAGDQLAGRADEVYLTPDLWWDQAGRAAEGGFTGAGIFPGDASGDHGGAIAEVDSPGGLFNLAGLSAGPLGSSATIYRDANGVSGTGYYTIYYDAIEAVENSFPVPPDQPTTPSVPVPFAPFDFFGLVFSETYDAFFREEDLWDEVGGSGDELLALLGLFERDETTLEESGAWKPENVLDNAFGPRRDSSDEEERDEERESRIRRAQNGGPVGMTFYVFEPGTNRYSSYRVFGHQVAGFYPAY